MHTHKHNTMHTHKHTLTTRPPRAPRTLTRTLTRTRTHSHTHGYHPFMFSVPRTHAARFPQSRVPEGTNKRPDAGTKEDAPHHYSGPVTHSSSITFFAVHVLEFKPTHLILRLFLYFTLTLYHYFGLYITSPHPPPPPQTLQLPTRPSTHTFPSGKTKSRTLKDKAFQTEFVSRLEKPEWVPYMRHLPSGSRYVLPSIHPPRRV